MAHKSMKSLLDAISKKASKSLKNNVAPKVREEMQSQIRKEVYEPYTPTEYDRTYQLLEDSSVLSNVHGSLGRFDSIRLTVTHDDPRGISNLVLLGQQKAIAYGVGMKYDESMISKAKRSWEAKHSQDTKGFWEERNFIDTTKTMIQADRTSIVKALKEGMK